jgi:hypothetical protein
MTTYKYKNHLIKIEYDECHESPREWDNLGTMVCFHRNYILGDETDLDQQTVQGIANSKNHEALPLYLLDHSGLTMKTSPFNDHWDSGQVGYIFCSHNKARKRFDWENKKLSNEQKKEILKTLEREVDLYNKYMQGEVFYFSIEGDWTDSCGGFYSVEEALCEAKNGIDWFLHSETNKATTLKTHGVPCCEA